MSTGQMHPLAKPFDAYLAAQSNLPCGPQAVVAHELIAMSKRILLQQNVRDFTGADVVALATLIASLKP